MSALKNVSDTPPWGPAHLLAPCNGLDFKQLFRIYTQPQPRGTVKLCIHSHSPSLVSRTKCISACSLCKSSTHTCFTLERDLPCTHSNWTNSSQILCKLSCFCTDAWAKEKRFVKKYFLKLHFETQFFKHSGQMNVKHYIKSTQSKVRFFLEIIPSTKM